MPPAPLVALDRVSLALGDRLLLDGVSIGVAAGERIGVVGRNGAGKTTLLDVLAGGVVPDSGRVTRSSGVPVSALSQRDRLDPNSSVLTAALGDRDTHEWAADPATREVVQTLLAGVGLDRTVDSLSGGERRRAALAAVLLHPGDVVLLDEPTNHLDVETVAWLAGHLTGRNRPRSLVVVTHDRWFLDAVCSRTWEVHGGAVDSYDGGYAAYVLARAERDRQARVSEAKRRNLVRKELAWLRRGPPARTSKPQFRIDAATALIADEPPPRNRLALEQLAVTRLGKDVLDLEGVTIERGGRRLLRDVTWRVGPGDRLGLVGVNGAGKTTVLRALAGELIPAAGRVKRGKTVRVAHLQQDVEPLAPDLRVLAAAQQVGRVVRTAAGEQTVTSLLERFGFTGEQLQARVADLSGGERRRLQLLRLLLTEPNVLLLDEPTNDLDIDTLTVLEDYLDEWPGTIVLVTHDRYVLERVCDTVHGMLGDGTVRMLPGGVDEYLQRRSVAGDVTGVAIGPPAEPAVGTAAEPAASAADRREAGKAVSRLDRQLAKVSARETALHDQLAVAGTAGAEHARMRELAAELDVAVAERTMLEEQWLAAAEAAEAADG
ncbi:MAG: ATP-binding cassette domain-containing protein [Actinomycetota bacterium]|nr:ATP-binding cassette domain-containing protein [Actinomycetota bacterium]